MPKPTPRTPACRWSLPTAARFTTHQPAATRPCSNLNSQWRRSSRRHGPAAACHSALVMWLSTEQDVFAQRGEKQVMCCRREERTEGKMECSCLLTSFVLFLPSFKLLPEKTVGPIEGVETCPCTSLSGDSCYSWRHLPQMQECFKCSREDGATFFLHKSLGLKFLVIYGVSLEDMPNG